MEEGRQLVYRYGWRPKKNVGTCGVTLHNKTLDIELCQSMSAENCGLGQLHSTREELRAVIAAEAIIQVCNTQFGTTNQNIEFICDNKSALGKIRYENGKQQEVRPLASEAELLMEIRQLRETSENIERTFHWVKSHQDEDENHILTDHEQINQRADDLATAAREAVQDGLLESHPKQIFKNAKITLTIRGCVVSKDLKNEITRALYSEKLKTFLCRKYGWNETIFTSIDWDAHESELGKLRGLYKISIYKLIHRWQATNKVVQRNERKPPGSAKCTECGHIDEQLHYMRCLSVYFVEARQYAWKKFKNVIKQYKYHTTMISVMWVGIQRWISDDLEEMDGDAAPDLPWGDEVNEEQKAMLSKAYTSQTKIGWDHFIVGRISKEWSDYFEYALEKNDETSGKVIAFTRTIVKATWTYTLSVWTSHNEAVHGKNNKYSTRDAQHIQDCITYIYEKLQNHISQEDRWLFREEVRIRCNQTIPQMAGLKELF